MNVVHLVGRLGKNPELKEFDWGKVASFSLATSKKIKGEDQVQWHNIKVFNKTAEICDKHLSKGSQVLVTGEIRYNRAKDESGKVFTEIVANDVEFVGPKVERADAPPQQDLDVPF